MREIKISAVLNGFLVKAGCQTLVFQDKRELLRELEAYLDNPQATEERFLKNAKYAYTGGAGEPIATDNAPMAAQARYHAERTYNFAPPCPPPAPTIGYHDTNTAGNVGTYRGGC